jgi:hypothetical protein
MTDLFKKMGKELRSLFRDLFDPNHKQTVVKKMGRILETAREIGGPVYKEAKMLNQDIEQYLAHPLDSKRIAVMKEHAARLEQETREF